MPSAAGRTKYVAYSTAVGLPRSCRGHEARGRERIRHAVGSHAAGQVPRMPVVSERWPRGGGDVHNDGEAAQLHPHAVRDVGGESGGWPEA